MLIETNRMENVDPVGVHTGDSVVVAPALTLSDREYQMLRTASLRMIEAIGIVGGCNCQFALNPDSFEYAVIEVNPRVSRSSALASKATGYPIAKISTRIALGYTLDEIANDITGKTCACFEPTLDYVVVKFPKWPFDKFRGSSRKLGTQMKATGEVMAIGQSFEEALMKAVRGAEIGFDSLNAPPLSDAPVTKRLASQDDRRLFTVFEALKSGLTVDEIFEITKIDRWFLYKLQGMAELENRVEKTGFVENDYALLKRLGYPDPWTWAKRPLLQRKFRCLPTQRKSSTRLWKSAGRNTPSPAYRWAIPIAWCSATPLTGLISPSSARSSSTRTCSPNG